MLEHLQDFQVGDLKRSIRESDLWHGHVVKAVDGTSTQLPDTGENQTAYPQPSGQQPGCGFPVMKLAVLTNLCHGGIECFATADRFHHDARMLDGLLPSVGRGEVLLADRAYASYELFALMGRKHSWLVARQHHCRKVDWRKGRKLGPDSRLVIWGKPAQPRGSGLDRGQWDALPAEMCVRLVRAKGLGRDGRKKTYYIATNLLDGQAYPSGDIAELYLQRWQIELCFRDIKTTMGMERLRTKTPAMVAKELRMFVIAHNAVRQLIMRACLRHGGERRRVSFQGCLDVLHTFQGQFRKLHHLPKNLEGAFAWMLALVAQRVCPERPGRSEPRAVKRRPKPGQYLTRHRKEFKEIPHLNHYRKSNETAS